MKNITCNKAPMNYLMISKFWTGYLLAALGAITSFILPLAPFLVFTLSLVLCDLITGTQAAKKRGEAINSRGLRRTVEKIGLYFIVILLSEGMRVIFVPAIEVAYLSAFAIALTEFKSNIENVETVTGVSVWRFLKSKFEIKI